MSVILKRLKILVLSIGVILFAVPMAFAGTLGHYYPGVTGMRDIILPPKGFYAIYYNPIYGSDDLRNADGKKVSHFARSVSETEYLNIDGRQVPLTLSANLSADISTAMRFTTQQLLLLY